MVEGVEYAYSHGPLGISADIGGVQAGGDVVFHLSQRMGRLSCRLYLSGTLLLYRDGDRCRKDPDCTGTNDAPIPRT